MEEVQDKISFTSELKRKFIHISSSWIAFAYIFLSKELMIIILAGLFLGSLLSDIARYYSKWFNDFYMKVVGPVLRSHEVKLKSITLTGATYLMFSALLSVVIFPKEVAISAIFLMTIGDAVAAVIGKSFGRLKFYTKTFEGGLAFFIAGVIIVLLAPKLSNNVNEYYIGIAAVFVTTIIEMLPLKLDDNITVPIVFGLSYLSFIKIFLN
ncbi:MAG: dolichol kinase [Ignavibacteriae bacterium]|nr:dolichol kinase [Ignavibacteriota bacterium]